MKTNALVFLTAILFMACSNQTGFPEKKSERMLQKREATKNFNSEIHSSRFAELETYTNQFNDKNHEFNLESFISSWKKTKEAIHFSGFTNKELLEWVEINGFLLELTGESVFAEELEKAQAYLPKSSTAFKPFVFTKNLDNVFVNLFQNEEINYTHTTGGEVNIMQETNYPNSGNIILHFGMTKRRYIELNIRIPMWADGATVTVKQVKYFTAPGEYCKIAKKWKEGDLVLIEFPIEKRPKNF